MIICSYDHMLNQRDTERLASLFKALGDPTRLRLVAALDGPERCVHELVDTLEMTQSAISHQLRVLRDLGIVRGRREGRHIYYQLDDEHVRALFTMGLAHVRHVDESETKGPSS